ncbi:MAG: hypothetical protein KBB29_07685, partial [Bacteroidales bacterium]|nr:hypothetical protein [Bacteroidales bacterium]
LNIPPLQGLIYHTATPQGAAPLATYSAPLGLKKEESIKWICPVLEGFTLRQTQGRLLRLVLQ